MNNYIDKIRNKKTGEERPIRDTTIIPNNDESAAEILKTISIGGTNYSIPAACDNNPLEVTGGTMEGAINFNSESTQSIIKIDDVDIIKINDGYYRIEKIDSMKFNNVVNLLNSNDIKILESTSEFTKLNNSVSNTSIELNDGVVKLQIDDVDRVKFIPAGTKGLTIQNQNSSTLVGWYDDASNTVNINDSNGRPIITRSNGNSNYFRLKNDESVFPIITANDTYTGLYSGIGVFISSNDTNTTLYRPANNGTFTSVILDDNGTTVKGNLIIDNDNNDLIIKNKNNINVIESKDTSVAAPHTTINDPTNTASIKLSGSGITLESGSGSDYPQISLQKDSGIMFMNSSGEYPPLVYMTNRQVQIYGELCIGNHSDSKLNLINAGIIGAKARINYNDAEVAMLSDTVTQGKKYWHQIKIVVNPDKLQGNQSGDYDNTYPLCTMLDYYSDDETAITTYTQLANIIGETHVNKTRITGIMLHNFQSTGGKAYINYLYKSNTTIHALVQYPFDYLYNIINEELYNNDYFIITDNVLGEYGFTKDIPLTCLKTMTVEVDYDNADEPATLTVPFGIQLPYNDDEITETQAIQLLYYNRYLNQHLLKSRITTSNTEGTFSDFKVFMINSVPTLVKVGASVGIVWDDITGHFAGYGVLIEYTNLTTCERTTKTIPIYVEE